MFLFRRPSSATIASIIEASALLGLSYEPIGLAHQGAAGFSRDVYRRVIGHGPDTYARAREALRDWRQFDVGWVSLFPARPSIEPGTNIAVLIRHLGFWSLNGGRLVYVLEQSDWVFGYAYGTLTTHAEAGEEIFAVSLEPDGSVVYEIRAGSRPRALLARLGHPLARLLQARFRRDSARALQRAVNP